MGSLVPLFLHTCLSFYSYIMFVIETILISEQITGYRFEALLEVWKALVCTSMESLSEMLRNRLGEVFVFHTTIPALHWKFYRLS